MNIKESWTKTNSWFRQKLQLEKDRTKGQAVDLGTIEKNTLSFQMGQLPANYQHAIKSALLNNVWVIPRDIKIDTVKKDDFFMIKVRFQGIGNSHHSEIYEEVLNALS